MRTSPRVIGAAAGVVALLVSGCTSSTAGPGEGVTESVSPVATSSPSASQQPSPTESASPSDPFAVPDPVTEEYVDRVVNTIYAEWGAIIREILEQPADPSGITDVETRERITALFDGEYFLDRVSEADRRFRGERDGLLSAEEFSSVKFRTRQVLDDAENCMVVAGDFDTSGTATEPTSILVALSLSRFDEEQDGLNTTGWRIVDILANTGTDGEVLDDDVMLEASIGDFGDLLTTACEAG